MRLALLSISLGSLGLFGCPGDAPPDITDHPDAPSADAAFVDPGLKVSGKAKDYFAGGAPTADATITTEGIDPVIMSTSATAGDYELDHVPVGSKIYAIVGHPNFRDTRNPVISVDAMPVTQDVYMLGSADVNRQYASVGMPVGAGKAFFEADLVRANGTPIEGIALTAVTLVDSTNTPVPGIIGPYFVGSAGDVDTTVTTATMFGGKSRVAILDVPPGQYTLKVVDGATTLSVPATFTADGATLATTAPETGGNGNITNPKFTTDIYPRLQKAATGGLGCANCHTLGGVAGGVLIYDDPAATVLTNIKAATGVLDLTTPANSLFLTKPLYEPPPYNHPNATFIDVNDPDYKLFLLWIQQGAL